MSVTPQTWCARDGHKSLECFVDFNEWLDGDTDEVEAVREANQKHNAFLAELGLPPLP